MNEKDFKEDGYCLTGVYLTKSVLVLRLPEEFRDTPVVEIGEDCCFTDKPFLAYVAKRVVVPEGVRVIGEGAVGEMYALEQMGLPDTLTYIDPDAFRGSEDLVIHYGGTPEMWESIYQQGENTGELTIYYNCE